MTPPDKSAAPYPPVAARKEIHRHRRREAESVSRTLTSHTRIIVLPKCRMIWHNSRKEHLKAATRKLKTPSQFKRLDIEDLSFGRISVRSLPSAPLIGVLLVFTLVNGGAEPERIGFCRHTAQAALTSCRRAAESDYWVAWGKCDNLTDPAARENCRNQAAADRNEVWQACDDQNDARLAACQRLGEAPYDPVIDPSNFVARVDNLYFPLTPGTTFIYEGQTTQGFEHD
jgi:hypothetical protein